ncbi:cytochrome c oxidase assembly protein [Lentibacillus halophilus]|uniref:cytochrome c oxidase assembly protein n=1 Tax=Lentibacillus halophilus TaxID=295065 RepID=UPI0031D2C94F
MIEYIQLLVGGQLEWGYPLLAFLCCIAVLYAFLIKRYTQLKLIHIEPLFFLFGLGLLYVTAGSPLADISHLSLSLHMIQMSILYFLIPPVFLLGIPDQLFNHVFQILKLNRISKLFFAPKIALYAFAALFFMYHLPFVLMILSKSAQMQSGYIFVLFLLSFGMWWPIAAPDSNQRLCRSDMKRYAFLSGIILMPACLLLIFMAVIDIGNNTSLSQTTAPYCSPSQAGSFSLLPPPFNTKFDQLMAGIVMLGLHKAGLMVTFKLRDKFRASIPSS